MLSETARVEKVWRWPSVVGLGFLSMVLGMILGFLPQYLWTKLVSPPFSNTGFVVGLPMGFFVTSIVIGYVCLGKLDASRASGHTWIVGVCWLLFGLMSGAYGWNPAWDKFGRWDTAVSELIAFPHGCGATECWGTVIYYAPCFCTLGFSVGARVAARRELITNY